MRVHPRRVSKPWGLVVGLKRLGVVPYIMYANKSQFEAEESGTGRSSETKHDLKTPSLR